jgi:arylsulfatase
MPLAIGLAGGIVCGADTGSPVWDRYKPPFPFTGVLHSTTVDLGGGATPVDHEHALKVILARQ